MQENTEINHITYIYTRFETEQGFGAKLYKNEDSNEEIVCTGLNLPDNKNLSYRFIGNWSNHPKYGRQFQVDAYQVSVDSDRTSIVNYLSSGMIKGIGKKTAEKIYSMFGTKSLDILKNSPEELTKVKGISPKRLNAIMDSYKENTVMEELLLFLSPYGFSNKTIASVYKLYKENAVEKLKENPYLICNFRGVSFDMGDKLGAAFGFGGFAKERVLACVKKVMRENMQSGSVGITKEELIFGIPEKRIKGVIYQLGFTQREAPVLWQHIVAMIKDKKLDYCKTLIDGEIVQYLYEPQIKKTEAELAESLLCHAKASSSTPSDLENLIRESETGLQFKLDQTQTDAIRHAFTSNLSIITGGPGTGKTTICKTICDIARKAYPDEEITLLAPTGRAARRLSECTGIQASTIHSALHLSLHEENQEYDDEIEPIEGGTVIIDEFSMVDMNLAHVLFNNIIDARIIVVGDINQLESVGAGCVLRDMLTSEFIPVTYLKYVHRQESFSGICENADRMQRGVTDLAQTEDFRCCYVDTNNTDYVKAVENAMLTLYIKDIETYGIKNVAMLAPYKKYDAGVYALNLRLQEILNPLDGRVELKGLNNMTFRTGDRVMQLVNSDSVSNGDLGTVVDVHEVDEKMTAIVEFDNGETETYSSENNETITLAYASTVHKAQGSEYASIIMCLLPFHKMMLRRNILYTGITRAKTKCTIFTTPETLASSIHNNSIENRHTMLGHYLRKKYQENFQQLRFNA